MKILLLFLLSFLFGGKTLGQFVNNTVDKGLPADSEIAYNSGLKKIIDQLPNENSSNETTGHRLVIVYEEPENCLAENQNPISKSTETEYITVTTTTDVYVTRTLNDCQNEDECSSKVEKICVTQTYTTVANEYVTATTDLIEEEFAASGSKSSGSRNHKDSNPQEGNSHENIADMNSGYRNNEDSNSREGNSDENNVDMSSGYRNHKDSNSGEGNSDNKFSDSSSFGGRYSYEKDSGYEKIDSYYSGNSGSDRQRVIPGAFAMEIIASLGYAYTTTIFKDAATTSVEYSTKPTPLSMTKSNPILELETLQGPQSIIINQWSFSATVSENEEYHYVQKGASFKTSAPFATDSTGRVESHHTESVDSEGLPIKTEMAHKTDMESGTNALFTGSASFYRNDSFVNASRPAILNNQTNVSTALNSPELNSSESLVSIMSIEPSESSKVPEFVVLTPRTKCINHKNLFEKISDLNPEEIYEGKPHPAQIPQGVSNNLPYETNKFYTNLLTGSQTQTVFTWPYEVYWENTEKNGFAIQYPDSKRKTFGGEGVGGGSRYYWNNIKAPGIFVGATSIVKDNNYLTVSDMRELSVKAKISPEVDAKENYIEFPLVEGMGVVTSIYHGSLISKIQGNGGVSNFTKVEYEKKLPNTLMYRVDVGLGETWLLIITLPNSESDFELKKEGEENYLVGSKAVDGLIVQVALAPSEDERDLEAVYYALAGQYVTDAKVSGGISCDDVSYKIGYETEGISYAKTPLIFALPHHDGLFDGEMESRDSKITMPSTTKGMMRGYLSDELLFSHKIDNNIQWLPYLKDQDTSLTYKRDQIELIREAAVEELKDVDVAKTVLELDSQYFMGKAVDKYAYMMYVLHEIVKDEELADKVLESLKEFFEVYKAQKNKTPLFYDTKFKGVTSVAAMISPEADYGSGYYNDHNFHYSYIIHAAALIGKIDAQNGGKWAMENKEFINTLVRDVANPSEDDKYFPVSRSFDWFQGHSWAHGITEINDGKDLESSSEDVNFSYAMKMWGRVTGDSAMEARGDLMLSIQTRSFDSYFLYKDDNEIVPKEMLKNKVAGIFFENKVDYATWFGDKPEYKHGIQMIPITPALGSVRSATFAEQEWTQILSAVKVEGPWKGVLNSNRVFFDPAASWDYFANPDFNYKSGMDDGQSRVWALAFSAPFKNKAENVSVEPTV